jgi:hypothetical protein
MIIPFAPEHGKLILERNKASGVEYPLSQEEMITVWMIPGSQAMTLLDPDPVVIGGIINMGWNRGEAWLEKAADYKIRKDAFRAIRHFVDKLAEIGGFVRVQASSYQSDKCALFRHLGFIYEGARACYGPNRETSYLYARVF